MLRILWVGRQQLLKILQILLVIRVYSKHYFVEKPAILHKIALDTELDHLNDTGRREAYLKVAIQYLNKFLSAVEDQTNDLEPSRLLEVSIVCVEREQIVRGWAWRMGKAVMGFRGGVGTKVEVVLRKI